MTRPTGSANKHEVWTPELLERVLAMWVEGHSAGDIGKVVGLTRNQVIGKITRTTPRRDCAPRKPRAPRAPRPRLKTPSLPALVKGSIALIPFHQPKPPDPNRPPAPLLDMLPDGCRFPVSPHNARVHVFCNQPQLETSSYCGPHHDLCQPKNLVREPK